MQSQGIHREAGPQPNRRTASPRRQKQARSIEQIAFRRHGRLSGDDGPYPALIARLLSGRGHVSDAYIGRAINLTDAERESIGAWTIWPVDPGETPRERKLRKDRERQARSRAKKPATVPASTRKDRCEALLREVLADGPKTEADIRRQAIKRGLEEKGATRRGKAMRLAKEALGIVSTKAGLGGGWTWSLPESEKTQCSSKGPFSCHAPHQNTQETQHSSKGPLRVAPSRVVADTFVPPDGPLGGHRRLRAEESKEGARQRYEVCGRPVLTIHTTRVDRRDAREGEGVAMTQSATLQRRHAGTVEAVRLGLLPASVLEGRAA